MVNNNFFDILIIGAGVVGCAVARELSRFKLTIGVVEKNSDVAGGASGRNSGVVHAGFNNRPNSLKAKFCVEGNALFEKLCKELSVPFKRTGKLVVALTDNDIPILEKLVADGKTNGVPGLTIVSQNEINKLQPGVSGIAALFSPSTAVTSPFLLTVGLAENAAKNGVKFFFNSKVTKIQRNESIFQVSAGTKKFTTKLIVNSAGINSDDVAKIAGMPGYKLYPCRGEYHVLDKNLSTFLSMPVYPAPRPGSGVLGVHLTPTVDGNILIGPSAEFISSKSDHATTTVVMRRLIEEARQLMPILPYNQIIRSYSGIRAKLTPPGKGGDTDFLVEEASDVPGLINLIGIESPGLTSAIPLARRVVKLVSRHFNLVENPEFSPFRKAIPRFSELSEDDRKDIVTSDPDFGDIICRCEMVSRREVIEAISNPLGVRSLSAIKYRTRCMMGRCQGGYCLPKIVEILIGEFGLKPEEIFERNPGSNLFTGNLKN